jgi:predicted permease
MRGVLLGFGTIWAVTAVGWVLGRFEILGPRAETVLARLVFFVATPALLFETLATSSLSAILSPALVPFVASTAIVAAVAAVLARVVWHSSRGETAVASLAASYVNAANLGIPIASYVLGDVSVVAPVLLFQVLIASPTALAVLESETPGQRTQLRRLALLPARNPIMIGSAAGVLCAAVGWRPPMEVLRPFELVGSAAVPLALLALGMSLRGSRPFAAGEDAGLRYTAVTFKVLLQPALAYAIGHFLLGLDGALLLAAVVTSALPTAQNVFVYATRYDRGQALARDAVVLSTLVGALTLAAIVALLG